MFRIPFLPAFLCLMAITALSVSPGLPMPKVNLISSDKIGHLFAYGTLTLLLFLGYRAKYGIAANRKAGLVLFGFSAVYGVLMEWVQGTFFPYRFFEVADMLANAAGALLVFAFFTWRYRKTAYPAASGLNSRQLE